MSGSELWNTFSHLVEQDILSYADVEFSRFLHKRLSRMSGEVILAACLTSYYFRQGNVCLPLDEVAGKPVFEEAEDGADLTGPELHDWVDELKACALVGEPGEFKPLIIDKSNRVYLHKLWYYERGLAQNIAKRCRAESSTVNELLLSDSLSRLFKDPPEGETDWQKVATMASVLNRFTIISGGPGTGKTSTVVRILALLAEQNLHAGNHPSIALAAPTGKAAARLKDSILSIRDNLPVSEEVRNAIPAETMTLHQLLGARRTSSVFRHNRDNPLPYDIVIVDEASMVDQALMGKLLDALLDDTRLILLGDKDQLASVEAGSVMGDLCAIDENRLSKDFVEKLNIFSLEIAESCVAEKEEILTDHIILLTKSYRFKGDSGIARLAASINKGDTDEALLVLNTERYPEVHFLMDGEEDFGSKLELLVTDYFEQIIGTGNHEESFEVFNNFRILAAHRRGPKGVEYLNQVIEHMLRRRGYVSGYQNWYHGKPVIINENDYSLRLHNGDTGICLPDQNGDLKVYISHEGELRSLSPARLPDYSLAFALTVHKSQGSEFDKVLMVLPDQSSRIMTRELLYTAVTRAREEVMIAGSPTILSEGIRTQLKRTSGLQDQLWGAVR